MSTTADTTSKDPYIRGTDETVLLDLRELRAQEAADKAAREAAALGTGTAGTAGTSGVQGAPGAELERYHGSHRRDAVLYADGGTAIPLDRVREVCHDLRQPVAAILMLASAAELRPDVPERVRDVLQEIMSQTEEISATVRQFLDDAKQGVDGLGEPVPCNVAGLAAESVERWRATFDGDLALAAAEEPLHVTVDPILFKRALGNVLSNGTRAAGDSGRVQVTVRRFETAQGERAVIEVDDSGPGFGNIPAGHGLGLAVVRRTIEAAGGAVEFADGPMGGALVRLVLPVTPIRPLSAEDELTKTFHGEISLSQLAAELAAGAAGGLSGTGMHPALAEFEDEDFDDFDEIDEIDEVDDFDRLDRLDEGDEPVTPAAGGHALTGGSPSLTGGHALTTRFSAWPEPLAISGAPEQPAIGGDAEVANPFGARAAEAADNRSYFGLPAREIAAPRAPEPTAADRGFFEAAEPKSPAADQGYFGLPLKSDNAAPAPAPASRRYGAPEEIAPAGHQPAGHQQRSDISAHPVPPGLLAAHRAAASQTPQGQAAIRPAARPEERAVSNAAIANTAHAAAAPAPGAAAAPSAAAQPRHTGSPTPPPAQSPASPAAPLPAPAYDPTDTQPLHIIPTGQDDTALASIQLPSQANLTHPPRIPASALRPVAEVQLSLLPGGAF